MLQHYTIVRIYLALSSQNTYLSSQILYPESWLEGEWQENSKKKTQLVFTLLAVFGCNHYVSVNDFQSLRCGPPSGKAWEKAPPHPNMVCFLSFTQLPRCLFDQKYVIWLKEDQKSRQDRPVLRFGITSDETKSRKDQSEEYYNSPKLWCVWTRDLSGMSFLVF